MTEKNAQLEAGLASDLNRELGNTYQSFNITFCDEKTIQNNEWQNTLPNQTGLWFMKCDETEDEEEMVNVRFINGELWAVDCAIGSLPVAMYHNGLCNCLWRYA